MARTVEANGHHAQSTKQPAEDGSEDDLTLAIARLNISQPGAPLAAGAIEVVKSSAKVTLLDNPAVKFIHGDIEGDVYLEKIIKLSKESREKIASGESEIPEGLSQGDLYLCPESVDAIQGALGTVCEAVDDIMDQSSSTSRAFVAVRPPGHHCGEDTPCGFCFVNNVAVAAAHAHLKHDVTRVLIFDIDLHHGNGTQSIIWQINEETYRVKLEESYGKPPGKPGLQVFYGSLHDILSFPCEDGKSELVQAASVSIHGPHGQFIENIHLEPYTTEKEFFENVYEKKYSRLLEKARNFIDATGGVKDDTLVFISCGFDACEHEHESMSRHQRKVPVSFYHRFARDAQSFAEVVAKGKLISVLEGGYSDRALTSGAIAHISGLSETESVKADPSWWALENLVALEKATAKRRGGRQSLTRTEPWLERTLEFFAQINTDPPPAVPPTAMALRDRSTKNKTSASTAAPRKVVKKRPQDKATIKQELTEPETAHVPRSDTERSADESSTDVAKKPRRVILKLGPNPVGAKADPDVREA
ncbi:histone deacetylase HOS3 [Phanerochaete sordida]|uniref:Histone deacetylase HOS3 n=1 Tax=Phanerochaete sordida TaxID=48140 RepID=A0A9P3G0G6_9APHY|nr:histone deacetylase HOS3 [Phanerochaete sordida]